MPSATTMPGQFESAVPEFDVSRAILKGPDMFTRFRVSGEGQPLSSARLKPDTELIVFQRGQQRRALDRLQMAYRHIAQGELDGQPYVVAYCGACNMAIGLTPVVDGRVHHFSLGGVYNAMMLMIDDESRTYWDYVTGRALHGELAGASIETWGVEMASVDSVLQSDPDLRAHLYPSPLFGQLVAWADRHLSHWLPPGFKNTMGDPDCRQHGMELGLGVVTEQTQRFYPRRAIKSALTDELGGRTLEIHVADDGMPAAIWSDGTRPLQFLTRWYGFSSSFPSCEIHGEDDGPGSQDGKHPNSRNN